MVHSIVSNHFSTTITTTTTQHVHHHHHSNEPKAVPCVSTPKSSQEVKRTKDGKIAKKKGRKQKFFITEEELHKYYQYSQPEAAKRLGVSVSTLKRRYYKLFPGKRWPYPTSGNSSPKDHTNSDSEGEDIVDELTDDDDSSSQSPERTTPCQGNTTAKMHLLKNRMLASPKSTHIFAVANLPNTTVLVPNMQRSKMAIARIVHSEDVRDVKYIEPATFAWLKNVFETTSNSPGAR